MLIVIGSSSSLAKEISDIDQNTIFVGRTNPYKFTNWVCGSNLSTNTGIEDELIIFKNILLEYKDIKVFDLILLNGISSNSWEDSININLIATAKISLLFSEYIRENNIKGSVTLIGSASSYLGGKLPYSMTKASLVGLMNTLSKEYSPNVRINMVLPGAFESGMTEDWNNDKKVKISSATYQKRLANATEIVNAIIFCTENQYLSGATINMTSGGVKN